MAVFSFPPGLLATNNLQHWLLTSYAENKGLKTRKELLGSFRKELKERAEKVNVDYSTISKVAGDGFLEKKPPESFLSTKQVERVASLFKDDFDLTTKRLTAEIERRRLFIVLANVSLRSGYPMGEFLKDIYNASLIIESAYAVYGNHDCIFTIKATHYEIQDWLWNTARNRDGVTEFRSTTYQTYSDSYERWPSDEHPEYDRW